jgi:hypothetical protein
MPDGRRFRDIDEFKHLLLDDKEQVARALTINLVTYATGAAPREGDKDEVDVIVASMSKKNYGFRSLIHEIVQSGLFRSK